MQQPMYILEDGTRVVTHAALEDTRGMMVPPSYLGARKPNEKGAISGVVGGHGGDVYYVKHDSGDVGVYAFTEFELA